MTTTYRALTAGEYPPGLHWTAGETRVLPSWAVEDAPGWLTPAPVEAPREGGGAAAQPSDEAPHG